MGNVRFVHNMSDYSDKIPNDDDVLSNTIHPHVDLSGANLSDADLSGANLDHADLTGVDLSGANLADASLYKANLSDANLRRTDFSEAYLRNADLSRTDLRNADLTRAHLAEITLTNATLSRGTIIGDPSERIAQVLEKTDTASKTERYDTIARTNRELRSVYSRNGLISQARTARVRERRARRREAKAEEGWRGTIASIGSWLSAIFTGYGVRLIPVIGWMLVLYLSSTIVYSYWGGMAWDRSLYYSVVTFTTAPPEAPPSKFASIVAGIETFAGTAAIVFLGYVLGTRERV